MTGRVTADVTADVVVVGGGVAGRSAASAAARRGARVVLLAKGAETATRYAQGGIAVVLPGGEDSVAAHVRDTLVAGAGRCDPAAVASIVADGHRAVTDLVGAGARLDTTADGSPAVTREGGHGLRRVVHAGGDATGAEVQRALDAATASLPVLPGGGTAVLHDDGEVTGLLVDGPDGPRVLAAPSVVLATGGLGQLYTATTNPVGATGDGVALALAAGVTATDLEFVQFHPTMLYGASADGRRPLVTEALRGEGAVLVDVDGRPITAGVHPLGDLAPRDVVAAAVDARMRARGEACVYLDARRVPDLARRFPTVTAACLAEGIDPQRTPIPVVPGAHYSCGGVDTDVRGRTALAGLWAVGEVARTGMHGANRLASNSLLEGLVVGRRAGEDAAARAVTTTRRAVPTDPDAALPSAPPSTRLRAAMSRHAGVLRDGTGLEALRDVLADPEAGGTTAPAVAARALTAAALARVESRGCHQRTDHPDTDGHAAAVTVRLVDGVVRVDQPVAA